MCGLLVLLVHLLAVQLYPAFPYSSTSSLTGRQLQSSGVGHDQATTDQSWTHQKPTAGHGLLGDVLGVSALGLTHPAHGHAANKRDVTHSRTGRQEANATPRLPFRVSSSSAIANRILPVPSSSSSRRRFQSYTWHMDHHHHHQKAFRNKSHTSHGHRPGLKRNKSKGKRLTIN